MAKALKPEFAPWYADKDFTSDWTSNHISRWQTAFTKLDLDRPAEILEIGSYEGRSAIAFLNLLPGSRLTSVDAEIGPGAAERGVRLRNNLQPFGSRVKFLKALSLDVLPRMLVNNRQFDVIYIDGSHLRDAVVADTMLAWPLLRVGGLLIWDDYLWRSHLPAEQRPQPAIDWFLDRFEGSYDLLQKGSQVIVQKKEASFRASRTAGNLIRFLSKKPLKASWRTRRKI